MYGIALFRRTLGVVFCGYVRAGMLSTLSSTKVIFYCFTALSESW